MISGGLSRLINAFCSLTSLGLMLYGFTYYNPMLTGGAAYDYFAWASTVLALYALYRELKAYGDRSVASTLLLSLLGGLFVSAGRLLSLYYNSFRFIGYIGALIGERYTLQGFASSLLILSGSIILSASTLIHLAFKKPVELAQAPSFTAIYAGIRAGLELTYGLLDKAFSKNQNLVAVVVAIFAFTFRFIPELEWWPWLIGWDTPEYVAHLMDYLERLNPFTPYYWMGSYRNCPPLINIVLAPFAYLSDAWTVFKVYPSIAYGVMAALSAAIAMRVYGKSWRTGVFAGFLTTVYILNLRISWDYQRQLLGSIVMLTAILILESWGLIEGGWRRATIVALLLTACGLSHEVTGLAGFALSIALIYASIRLRRIIGVFAGSIGALSNFALEAWYWRKPYSYVAAVGYLPPGLSLATALDAQECISYLAAGYGLTLPLLVGVVFRHRRLYVNTVLAALLLAGLSPLIAPASSAVVWYRFLIGIAPLSSTLAAVGFTELSKSLKAAAVFMLLFALPGLSFTYGYNLASAGIYTRALREFPSMLTPAPANEMYLKTYEYFVSNRDSLRNAVIVAHPDMARYIHIAIRNPELGKLVWTWSSSLNYTICSAVEEAGTCEVIVVAPLRVNLTNVECVLKAEPIDEDYPWIVLVEASGCSCK